jgi:hypothetical protein
MTNSEKIALGVGVLLVGIVAAMAGTEPDEQPVKADPNPSPQPSKAEQKIVSYDQSDICYAVWLALSGDNTAFIDISANVKDMPIEQQAYLMAAARRGPIVFQDNIKWIKSFDKKAQKDFVAREKEQASKDAITGTVISGVGIAVNAIPVVGQALSAAIAIGYALSKAIEKGIGALPPRSGADQVYQARADENNYAGITLDRPENVGSANIRKQVKEWVEGNKFASKLPIPKPSGMYDFFPNISDYSAALRDLGV